MNARERLVKLEKSPKYTTENISADKEIKNNALDDPKFNELDGDVDLRWKKDSNGNWHHPDYE